MNRPASTNADRYRFAWRHHAEALYAALREDAFYITMELSAPGDAAARRDALLRYLDYSMVEADAYGLLYFPQDDRQGVAVWSRPLDAVREAAKTRAKIEFLEAHMGPDSVAKYADIVGFMGREAEALIDPADWYLSIVGVLPAAQNRGLGRELVSATLERADRAGVGSYLETFTPRNEPFYRRLGYRAVGSFVVPAIGAAYSLMRRECAAGS